MSCALVLALAVGGVACSSELLVGADGVRGVAGTGGEAGALGPFGSGGFAADAGPDSSRACVVVDCSGRTYDCGDCEDNDGDGLVDELDPDCLGACDSAEDRYYGGKIQNSCKQDCFFDGDNGGGNDGCYWSHQCDPLAVAPDYPPSGRSDCEYDEDANVPGSSESCAALRESQSANCEATCGPLTPNGCDCFGCCELPAGSGSFVWLGSEVAGEASCDAAGVEDSERCKPCTPVPSCFNVCERCEKCIGKGMVPSDC